MDTFTFNTNEKTISIHRFVCPHLRSNMYIILMGKEAIVIDPCEDETVPFLFESNDVIIVHILLTHEHYDHVSGLKWFKEHYQTDIFCHIKCAEVIESKKGSNPALVSLVYADQDKKDNGHRYRDFKEHYEPYSVKADRVFDNKDHISICDLDISIVSTPGHSPGSACYQLDDDIFFTGDTLLKDDPIIIRFSNSSKNKYEEITLPYLRSLKKTIHVLPGHGEPFILCETELL